MLVTLSGIVTLFKPLHSQNAELPMLVMLSGIVTLVKPLQYQNVPSAIPLIPAKSKSPE
jgi:hypothetical protein